MRHEVVKNLTYYIISAPKDEVSVTNFQNLLNLACHGGLELGLEPTLLQHPLEAHILLSRLLCESSQACMSLFRQSLFAQILTLYSS